VKKSALDVSPLYSHSEKRRNDPRHFGALANLSGEESAESVRLGGTRGGIESRFEYLNVGMRFSPAKAKESEILTRIG